MPALGLVGRLPLLVGEAELHGDISVAVLGADLEDRARAAFQHRHRDGDAVGLENLGHADFAAEQSDAHRETPSSIEVIVDADADQVGDAGGDDQRFVGGHWAPGPIGNASTYRAG